MREWTRSGLYCLKSGPWRIAKASTPQGWRYTLTHDAITKRWCGVVIHKPLGVFASASEAMEAAK